MTCDPRFSPKPSGRERLRTIYDGDDTNDNDDTRARARKEFRAGEHDMCSYKKVDDHTLTMMVKKGGKVTATGRIVVSADGKSRTVSTSGTDANRPIRVYDESGKVIETDEHKGDFKEW